MDDNHCPMMSWNVRDMNTSAKREAIREIALLHRLALLCLQETKIDVWDRGLVSDTGGALLADCIILLATGTREGGTILWNATLVSVSPHSIGQFAITAKVTMLQSGQSFWLTTMYGPAHDTRKDDFFLEISRAAPPTSEP